MNLLHKGKMNVLSLCFLRAGLEGRSKFIIQTLSQGRNMVYPEPTDPYFLAVILIPEPLFPQNFDP